MHRVFEMHIVHPCQFFAFHDRCFLPPEASWGFQHYFCCFTSLPLILVGYHTSKMVVAQIQTVSLTKPKIRGLQFSFFGTKPTGKTTKIVSRLTEADERGYLLSNDVLVRLEFGQRLDEL